MKVFMLSFKVNGIKNIEKEIEINFYNKTLKRFNPCGSNVKGIFGPNGIGKTSIIKGMDILRKISLNDNYLTNDFNIIILDKIINKKIEKAKLEVEFLVIKNKKKYRYIHSITIARTSTKEIKILNEKIIKKDPNTDQILWQILIENGIIKNDSIHKGDLKAQIIDVTKNLLEKRSVVNIVKSSLLESTDLENIYYFYKKLYIKLDRGDSHFTYALLDNILKAPMKDEVPFNNSIGNYDMTIPKNSLEVFEDYLRRMTKFLKIFKSNLKNIEYEKKEDEEYYYINILFVYNNYKVDYEFESMGIKNLFSLFTYFRALSDDEVVVIDEIDTSIHDIYLNKLIEFFAVDGKGQLVFTAHNITLLQTLKKYKHSIDFINENMEVVSWVKNGNSTPFKSYKDGYIKGLPFNIKEYDFLEIFSQESDVE
ncbi:MULTISPECIES: AAA family ATPase [Fusobacterium]|uniref:AAA family ATPase n=1 Tax=Fusobacterium TaxID=848 RepID=UPI00044A744C|nr:MULTISPECIES: AAA family ATPase [Fusobacterium]EUB40854.1 AAA domain protein [Fusobacterium sp. CM1]QYR64521.1 ATP-binding protein [Fusobacterium animalis]